jgi:hypothetical protein
MLMRTEDRKTVRSTCVGIDWDQKSTSLTKVRFTLTALLKVVRQREMTKIEFAQSGQSIKLD